MEESSERGESASLGTAELLAALRVAPCATAVLAGDRVRFANDALLRILKLSDVPLESFESLAAGLVGEARRSSDASLHGRFALSRERKGAPLYFDLSVVPLKEETRESHAVFVRLVPESDSERGAASAERMQSLGRLAASLAHDLNNPLAYVLGNLELAERSFESAPGEPGSNANPSIGEALAGARAGLDRVRAIVKDLTSFSRPIADTKDLVNVEDLLDSTIRFLWNEIRHRARLVKQYGGVAYVRGDESRLSQVFMNLLSNAAAGLEEGAALDAQIVLATRTEGACVVVEVSDTGAGIPEQDLSNVFEPFYARKSAHTGKGEATQLALSVCRAIVTAHGGDIVVVSRPGEGARFRVTLPAAGTRTRPKPLEPPSRAPAARARILIIDDEPLLGQTLGFAFSGRHDVVVTTSGREALALLARGDAAFDLVLCDLMMPDVSGQKVFETIESNHPELIRHFVFMTGGAFTESAQEFLERYPGRRIEKPFTMSEIESLIVPRGAAPSP